MRAFFLAFLGAGCALAIAAAFLIGRALGPDGSLHGSVERTAEEADFVRVTLELSAGGRAPGRADEPAGLEAGPTPRAVTPAAPRARARTPERREVLASAESRRTPPDVSVGPLLESWYSRDRLAYRGSQAPARDGTWVRHGSWEAWHENGQVHERGAYANGVEDGDWEWWYADGSPMAAGRFVDGKRFGDWTFWYEGGGLQMRGTYFENLGVGAWTYWFENGLVRAEGEMEVGLFSGRWSVWREDGSLDREASGVYEKGEKVGD